MNITMMCKINLSKKLRAILGEKGSIMLTTDVLSDGKGNGKISISTESDVVQTIDPKEIGETSIMLTPVEIGNESPTSADCPVATLFETVPSKGRKERVASKIAVTTPPDQHEVSHAVKSKDEIEESVNIGGLTKQEKTEYGRWITTMEELAKELNKSKQKKSDVDLTGADHPLQRAVLMEQKEREEAIDIPAWVVNEQAGSLTINDMGVDMPLNYPLDLTRISAKRVLASKDFWALLKSGFIRIISPEERDRFIGDMGSQEDTHGGAETFSNHREAMRSIEGDVDDDNNDDGHSRGVIDVNERNASDRTEDEQMMINLTERAPTNRNVQTTTRRFSNSNTPQRPNRPSPMSDGKKPAAKPVTRLD